MSGEEEIIAPGGQGGAYGGAPRGRGRGGGGDVNAQAEPFDLPRALSQGYDDGELARRLRNDMGNAERFIARHGRDCLWTEETGWAVWDGARFSFAGGEPEAVRRVQETARAMAAEVAALKASRPKLEDFRTAARHEEALAGWMAACGAHAKFAVTSGNYERGQKALKQAAPLLRVRMADLDARPHLLACPNATLELGAVVRARPPCRDDRLTKCTAAPFDPDADVRPMEALMEAVLPDPEVRRWTHKALGYALSGEIGEQLIVFFHGEGQNGKSSLLEAVRGALGDYALQTPIETLLPNEQRRGGQASPDLARLPGARLVTATEPGHGVTLDESVIKQMTGGEPMCARPLYGAPFEFYPQHKVFVAMNPKPNVKDASYATWRRMRLVPFLQTLAPEWFGPIRSAALAPAARSGVLLWLVNGYELWRAEGLDPPAAILEGTDAWKSETNPVPDFLNACVEWVEGEREPAGVMHRAFLAWADASGVTRMGAKAFGLAMRRAKVETLKASVNFYCRIRLLPEWREKAQAVEGKRGGLFG